MTYSTELVTSAATEPVSVAEAKAHLHLDGTSEDMYLEMLIQAAIQMVESDTRRKLSVQTWRVKRESFYDEKYYPRIALPFPPVGAVESVKYFASGVLETLATSAYTVSLGTPSVIIPKDKWPTVDTGRTDGVIITFTTGYAVAPKPLKVAVLQLVGHWYANRESVVVGSGLSATTLADGYDRLINLYRHFEF